MKGVHCAIILPRAFKGKVTFGGNSLHSLERGVGPNPYQHVIAYLGETLEELDEDGFIPAFGFGDSHTRDRSVFPLRVCSFCLSRSCVVQ